MCFNSLQTGKCIQRGLPRARNFSLLPSFNSLQTGKWIQRILTGYVPEYSNLKFQFPSNGKVDPKCLSAICRCPCWRICFNSLQTGKWIQSGSLPAHPSRCLGFQFPSNGKVDPKPDNNEDNNEEGKFQFPSNGKVDPKRTFAGTIRYLLQKVSIPFKRESGSKGLHTIVGTCTGIQFQFPSNGKVDPKPNNVQTSFILWKSFNSLQTGKWIQRNLSQEQN